MKTLRSNSNCTSGKHFVLSELNPISSSTISFRFTSIFLVFMKGIRISLTCLSNFYQSPILRCPCRCGDDLLINLDKRSGSAWRFCLKSGSYSLYPSYWRDTACGSHFIIWNNRIYWCHKEDESDEDWTVNEQIENIVLEAINENKFTHYMEIAEECALIPWESLQRCKQLSKKGLCIRVTGKAKGCFKKN